MEILNLSLGYVDNKERNMADNEYVRQCMCTTPEYTIELNKQGPPGLQGIPGTDGFSPKVEILQQDNINYRLRILTKDGQIDTPNLQGYGVPRGGSQGQYLVRGNGVDYQTEWQDLPVATVDQLGVLRIADEEDIANRVDDSAITPAQLAGIITPDVNSGILKDPETNKLYLDVDNTDGYLSIFLSDTSWDNVATSHINVNLANLKEGLGVADITSSVSYGIKGDYSTHYGILDTPNGIIDYSATSLQITIQPSLVLQMAGTDTKTTNASELNYILTSTNDCVLFYGEGGNLIEAEKVVYSTVEPTDAVSGYIAWFNPTVGKWQFKSNDTGNVWREAVATPIANIYITDGNITRLDYIGYRILDDELLVSKDMYDALLDRVTALETEINGGNA